jgi:hypothetical protein
MKSCGERVEGGHRKAEADAQKRRGHQQQPVGERLVLGQELADDQYDHGDEARSEAGEVHAFRAESTTEAGPEQGGGDRGNHLRQEQRPVLRARQVVLGRVREDRARGRERHEHDALRHARGVDGPRLGPAGHSG